VRTPQGVSVQLSSNLRSSYNNAGSGKKDTMSTIQPSSTNHYKERSSSIQNKDQRKPQTVIQTNVVKSGSSRTKDQRHSISGGYQIPTSQAKEQSSRRGSSQKVSSSLNAVNLSSSLNYNYSTTSGSDKRSRSQQQQAGSSKSGTTKNRSSSYHYQET
jgi:hypothetical protein